MGVLRAMRKTTKKSARKFVVSGRVQGVGYRFFAERWAGQLGISGYARNLWDGTVEVYAVGDEISLEEFKQHLYEGPRMARVTGISESEEAVETHRFGFSIE